MTPGLDPFSVPLHGVQLVEASAGTGKTHAISTLALRCLLERPAPVSQLLIVTFTNAATAELRDRIRRRIADLLAAIEGRLTATDPGAEELRALAARRRDDAHADAAALSAALNDFDDAAIFTIHGFCQRVLEEFAFESGVTFDAELVGDQGALLRDAVHDYWTRSLYGATEAVVRRLEERKIDISTLTKLAGLRAANPDLDIRLDPPAPDDTETAVYEFLSRAPGEIGADLARRKRAANVQCFDDLLLQLDGALAGPRGAALADHIRGRYPIAFIDEFQDTDPVQYRIFQHVYAGRDDAGLFLIGDPKQAIYAFRGADVFAYLAAKRQAGTMHKLATNRRSSRGYVTAVNTLFARAREQFVLPEIEFDPCAAEPRTDAELGGAAAGTAPLRVLMVRRRDAPTTKYGRLAAPQGDRDWFVAAITGAIVQLLNSDTRIGGERVQPRHIAVLCRKNRQCAWLHAALLRAGVPAVLQGEASVFEAPEAGMVERVLRAMAEPGDAAAVRAAVTTPLLGVRGDDLAAMRADERAWERWVERFHAWSDSWRGEGFAVAFQRLLDECAVPERVLSLPGGERTLTNVLHLAELLQTAAHEQRRGPLGLLDWLQAVRSDTSALGEMATEAAQIRLESDVHALTLTTVHKSKGLEYDVVVCPFLWDGQLPKGQEAALARFHDPQTGRLTLDLNPAEKKKGRRPSERDTLVKREALAEHLRLLYVAVTRARQLCLVAWGAFTHAENSALGYLLHNPAVPAGGDRIAATRDHLKNLTDEQIEAELAELATAADGQIAVQPLAAAADARYAHEPPAAAPLAPRPASRAVEQGWRVSSFTALVAGGVTLDARAEEGVDRDQLTAPAEPLVGAALRGVPRGRRLGSLVHKLFEEIDFTARDAAALRETVRRGVASFGMDESVIVPLCAMIDDVLDTPLTSNDPVLRLRDVARSRRLNEVEFAFPVALPAAGAGQGGVTATAIAEVLQHHGAAASVRDYATRLRGFRFARLTGFLRGFIDCVFEHDGRWYIVDYKSNDLGDTLADFAPASLAAEMERHDYVLQAHLYVVAVHRYLQHRLRGYDYERHFGGTLYLFVRGMHPSRGPATGVAFDRPPAPLVQALSDLLAGPATGARR